MKWLLEALPACLFPLGHPWAIRQAENKFRQLQVANQVGFKIPKYLFSNELASLKWFAKSHDNVVIKSPSQAIAVLDGEEKSFYASRVSSDALLMQLDDAKSAVGFFQTPVARDFDAKAFVGPGWQFAASTDVSGLPDGEVDWRPVVDDCLHASYEMPADILDRCREFLKYMNIPAGHFDFVNDPTGLEFLECNPNGQWFWLEVMAGCPITEHLAKTLASHASALV